MKLFQTSTDNIATYIAYQVNDTERKLTPMEKYAQALHMLIKLPMFSLGGCPLAVNYLKYTVCIQSHVADELQKRFSIGNYATTNLTNNNN